MTKFSDQIGNTIELNSKPRRVVSLVPSQSEFLWHIGLREELVGITKFCIHPDQMFRTIERIGGTKQLDIKKIRNLKPDLIIGNKEENEHSQIAALQNEFPVWISDICNFDNAIGMMTCLGSILGRAEQANEIVSELKSQLVRVKNVLPKVSVAYFIWHKPYMLAANNTFINSVLNYLGLENVAAGFDRYPEMNAEDLKKLNPAFCFLSSEPFPFKAKHVNELQALLPDARVLIVDGEIFSWYGTRLLLLEKYVGDLKHTLSH